VADAERNVYVYGVLPASEQASLPDAGVAGADVRTVEHAGLAAIVSDLEDGALVAAREVRAHWRVVEAVAAAATVLPVRFATVLAGDRAVVEQMLEPQAERLTTLLRSLAGRVQLAVKGEYDEEALLGEVVRETPAVQRLRERVHALPESAGYYDRIRLGELVSAEVTRRRQRDEKAAMDALAPHAEAARANEPRTPNGAFDLAFLVAREKVDGFGAPVRELGETLGERVRLRYVGPLPPYSFVDEQTAAEVAAWA
jgi:Gas vesicle synthesis protein GvpL/GvpF